MNSAGYDQQKQRNYETLKVRAIEDSTGNT